MDMLLSTGEQQSIALMSMALNHKGCPRFLLPGSRLEYNGQVTSQARIKAIEGLGKIKKALKDGKVVVVEFRV